MTRLRTLQHHSVPDIMKLIPVGILQGQSRPTHDLHQRKYSGHAPAMPHPQEQALERHPMLLLLLLLLLLLERLKIPQD